MKRKWSFQIMQPFKGKDAAFVSKWLTEKGLTKLRIVVFKVCIIVKYVQHS